ncbi:MAG: FKBP-type peptidyl-prolyl cis-trans isomerase [Vicinamibacteria bacterium]
MKRYSIAALVVAVAALCGACKPQEAPKPASPSPGTLATDQDKTVYAIGVMLGKNVQPLNFSPAEIEIIKAGLADAAAGKPPQVDMQTYGSKLQAFAQARIAEHVKGEKEKYRAFADNAAKEAGAVRTPSGLVFRTLAPGKGASPAATDTVSVNYVGTLTDGTEFDSSAKHGQAAQFKLNQVIPCWTEGVQKMKVGEKARLVCPSEIAYGDQGQPPIPPGATLVFEIELLDIKK